MNNADFVYRGLIKAGILTEGGAAATPPADTPGKSVDAQNKSKSIPDQMPRRAAVAGPPPDKAVLQAMIAKYREELRLPDHPPDEAALQAMP